MGLNFYRQMLLIRKFEERMYQLYSQGEIPGTVHPSIGQEAVAVGVCGALKDNDYVSTTHRGHGHVIARGASIKHMMAELLGKATGICRGKGGSMHIADLGKNILGATGIVGAGIPIATGAGLSIKTRKTRQVSVCFFGDGAANQGTFHESINMAAIWKLPVIYVCENNLYAMSCSALDAVSGDSIGGRARGYGIAGVVVDGMDVEAVFQVAKEAAKRARSGQGPTLMECKTYRYTGHSRGDPPYGPYRTKDEYLHWKEKDPIGRLAGSLSLSERDQEALLQEVEESVDEAVQFAREGPYPDVKEAYSHVYA